MGQLVGVLKDAGPSRSISIRQDDPADVLLARHGDAPVRDDHDRTR
jgi:hypothetical protein